MKEDVGYSLLDHEIDLYFQAQERGEEFIFSDDKTKTEFYRLKRLAEVSHDFDEACRAGVNFEFPPDLNPHAIAYLHELQAIIKFARKCWEV